MTASCALVPSLLRNARGTKTPSSAVSHCVAYLGWCLTSMFCASELPISSRSAAYSTAHSTGHNTGHNTEYRTKSTEHRTQSTEHGDRTHNPAGRTTHTRAQSTAQSRAHRNQSKNGDRFSPFSFPLVAPISGSRAPMPLGAIEPWYHQPYLLIARPEGNAYRVVICFL